MVEEAEGGTRGYNFGNCKAHFWSVPSNHLDWKLKIK